MMTNKEFAAKLIDCAKNHKTLYVMGCFGAPMNAANKKRYTSNYAYNKKAERTAMINAATADTFGFDCVCLLKGILWGWNGDASRTYSGASYASNGVPDIGADSIIGVCYEVSTDFSHLEVGELVWMSGHVGAYVGDGLVVECTTAWDNKVQLTACNRTISGYHRRDWTKHGKLPYLAYEVEPVKPAEPAEPEQPETPVAAREITSGSRVAFLDSSTVYYPNGSKIPSWVKNDYYHIVTQVTSNGKPVKKGGKVCVLLGKKAKKPDGAVEAGINSWVDTDNLVLVDETETEPVLRVHEVVKDDCLWALARKYLGNGARYTEIMELNGLATTVIYVGQKLNIPN